MNPAIELFRDDEVSKRIPKIARNLIARALNSVIPQVDFEPQHVEWVKREIIDSVELAVRRGRPGASGVVSLNYLASALSDGHYDPTVSEHLRGIAQSIACLCNQRLGGRS